MAEQEIELGRLLKIIGAKEYEIDVLRERVAVLAQSLEERQKRVETLTDELKKVADGSEKATTSGAGKKTGKKKADGKS